MFKTKKTVIVEDFSEVKVLLKPFLGMSPQLYLKLLYGFICVLTLFFFILYPGLIHYGSRVTFATSPLRASIYVNGNRVGSTPLTLFLPAGEHKISYHKPFFDSYEESVTIKGSRFFSLFFPQKISLSPKLNLNDLDGLLAYSFEEASFAYSATYSPQFPREPFLLNALEDLIDSQTTLNQDNILLWAAESWSIISDQSSLEEVITLWNKLKDKDLPIDAHLTTGIIFDTTNPKLSDIVQYQEKTSREVPLVSNNIPERPDIFLLNLKFQHVKPNTFLVGNSQDPSLKEFASIVPVEEFYFTKDLISQKDFNFIIRNIPNPDDQSVIDFDRFEPSRMNEIVKYVSMQGVKIFMSQINNELKRNNLPWKARLPYESEWEYLASNNLINIHQYEWTQEPYYPLKNLLFSNKITVRTQFKPMLHSIRGREPQTTSYTPYSQIYARGAQNPYWQTPYTSFRVILEPVS